MTRRWRRYLRVGSTMRDEVSDEVSFHLEEQVRDLMAAGATEAEARAAAAQLFGDRTRIERTVLAIDEARAREERRSAMVKDLRLDVRFAVRYLMRRRGFALVAVGVLAVGIGAATAVFAIADAALLRPLPFADPARVVRLSDVQREERGLSVSWPEVQDWQRELEFLDAFAAFGSNAYVLDDGGEPERLIGAMVAGDYAGVLGVSPVAGRTFTAAERETAADVVMLSEWLWRTRFGGSSSVLGRTIRLNDRPYSVIGVMPRAANVLAARTDIALWLPLAPASWATRGLHFMAAFGRVSPGMTVDEAVVRIEAVAQALRDEGVTEHGIQVESIRDRLVGTSRPLLLALAGAVLCLLLIVCANLASLYLSHATARRGEFAVRTALGAGRMRLTRQLLTESCIVALLGGAAGLLLGRVGTGVVGSTVAGAALLVPEGIDARIALFTAAATLVVAVLAGLWPALRAGADMGATLRDTVAQAGAGRGSMRARRALVGVEVALSVVLLAASGLMVRSLVRLLDEDPGFRAEGVLKFELSLPGSRYPEAAQAQLFGDLLERIRALPGVVAAGGVNELPLTGGDVTGGYGIVGREFMPDEVPSAKKRVVTPGYFEALGIPLLRGRTFDDTDRAGGREVAVVSESFARRWWPDEDAVGRRIRFSWGPGEEQEIIGVVGDVRHDGLDAAGQATMYRPLQQFPFPALALVVRSEQDPVALMESVRATVRSLDPSLPIDGVMTLRDVVRTSIRTRSTLMVMLTGFAAIALLLAAVGVYAITAFSVAQRTQEIGVRKALGARDRDVLGLVIRDEANVVALGLAAGVTGAVMAVPLLRASLYGIEPRDPFTLAAAAALLALIGLLAAWLPARRAARLDPVRALRSG